ncbi:ABC-type transport auxiliary lipoprotein family protein [Orbaceae bacterium ESL0727]|nr:ABC-type transport auxiliary lipoprotein family protein [Orbaceae bacterium ESL0727]
MMKDLAAMIACMKKRAVIVFAIPLLILAGCSSRVADKSYYQLADTLNHTTTPSTQTTNRIMFIEPIEVASFLDKSGLVLQTESIKYIIAANNLWVAPLSQQLEERVVQDLTVLSPHYLITSQPIATPTIKVKLVIDGFHGSYTGDAIIKGRWIVTHNNGEISSKAFNRQVPLLGNGYDALVQALSKGWQDEEADFVHQMKF